MTDRPIDVDVDPRVELAEKGPDFERRVGEPARVRNRPDPTAAELAEEDVLIERQDLGPGSSTFITSGDPIPPELRALPRRATREAPSRKR
jgi:hypothetical protein